jgi:hypothetical protein
VLGVVTGNPDRSDPRQLHRAAWDLVEGEVQRRVATLVATVAEQLGKGGALSEPAAVVEAADNGRVATLLVEAGATVWARRTDGSFEVHAEPEDGDVDLVGLAAVAALRTGAELAVARPAQLAAPLAALLRY